ncbi:MAG: tetratricopeptide repeat protein, partial [Planctomycetes bacterium]|nr:tetratricopeptide repeat protein [Planctomycetota bacterium]
NDHGGAYEYLRQAQQMAAATTDTREQRQVVVEASFRLAEFCSRHSLSEEMIESYRAALQQLDTSETALRQRAKLRIIDALLATNRLGEAEAETASFTREYPEETRGMVVEAELMIRRKQMVEAVETYTRVLVKVSDPNHQVHAYARYRRGLLYLDQGNYGAAKADLLVAKRSKPRAFGMKHRLALAQLYEATNQIAFAEAELREIIPLAADYRIAADRLVNLYRRTGQFERGQQIAREYMNKYPQRTFWPFALGSLLMARGEYSAAVEPLKRAVELSLEKNRAAAHHMYWQLLTAMVRAGRYDEAIDVLEKIETGATPSVRARGAEAYYRSGQRDRALGILEEALQEATDQEWSELLNVAQVGDYFLPDDSVVAFFKRLADERKQGPKSAQYDAVYTKILMLNDRASEARTLIESVIERTAIGASWRLPALEMLAELTSDDPEGQRRAYEKMLAEDADNVIASNNLAVLLAEKLNRPKEALKYAERAYELVSQNADILDTLGWVRFLNGDVEKAEQSLLAAIRVNPGNLPAHYHLGRVYAQRGLDGKARDEYQQAQKIARRARNVKYEKKIEEAIKKLP